MTPDEQAAIGHDIYERATALLAEYAARIAAGENPDELAAEFERRMPRLPDTTILNPLSK